MAGNERDIFCLHCLKIARAKKPGQGPFNFYTIPETDWTVLFMLSIGCHVKFDAHASKFDASVKISDAALPV